MSVCFVMGHGMGKFQILGLCSMNTSEVYMCFHDANLCHNRGRRPMETYLLKMLCALAHRWELVHYCVFYPMSLLCWKIHYNSESQADAVRYCSYSFSYSKLDERCVTCSGCQNPAITAVNGATWMRVCLSATFLISHLWWRPVTIYNSNNCFSLEVSLFPSCDLSK